ncbi:MAG: hypothetical protein QMB51_01965 [Patescibacteria group bacterium]
MKKIKIIFFILVLPLMISLQGCSFGFNKNINNGSNNNKTVKEKEKIDYVKEISKNVNDSNECNEYKERINSEIKEYEERVSRNTTNQEKFKLIGIFKSKSLNKCFYILEDSYSGKSGKGVDDIVNNAQEEETIDIFNNVDYDFLNERIEELQK